VADLKISELPALAGSLLAATDPLPLADLSASETKKITAKDLVQAGVALIDDGSIPAAKVSLTTPPGSIGTTELADGSVTAAKLASNSSAVVQSGLPASGAYIGQLAVNNTDNRAYVWSGSAWDAFKAAGSVNTLTYNNTTGPIDIAGVVTGDSIELSADLENTTSAAQFLAGPTGGAGTVNYRIIVGSDLPTATSTTQGAITVNGFGLKVDGTRLEIDNAVTPSTAFGVVTYDANGLVTDGREIQSGDLPLATGVSVGAVALGSQFTSISGTLSHSNSVAAGTATKVTFDAQGHITQGLALASTDIPTLDASKIGTGTFDPSRTADRSINAPKLADYSTAYIQDTQPTGTDHFHGQLWLNPLAQQIRMWDGNVWVPIGVGALSEQNLRFCGLFDATNGLITVLTQFGADAGFSVGDVIPVATEQLTGVYFVSETAGNGTGVTPGVNYDPGDWVLCLGVAQGWERIDTLNGGSGGASSLDGLTDVTITTPGTGQVLTYDGAIWVNQSIPPASTTVQGITLLTDSTSSISTTTAATPNAVKSAYDLAAAALPKSGGTMTGTITFAAGQTISGYLTTGSVGSTVQAYDADLTSIAALAGTNGLLRKTATNTWALDTTSYLTGNQTITFTGDATGSGTTSVALSLSSGSVSDAEVASGANIAGTKIQAGTTASRGTLQLTDNTSSTSTTTAATPNSVKSAYDLANAALPKSGGTMTGTIAFAAGQTISGYLTTSSVGITVQAYDADLNAIAALSGTDGILRKTGANTWSLDTTTYLTTSSVGSTVQAYDADLSAIAALSGTSGILRKTAADTWSLDTTTYLTSGSVGTTVQAYDADLDAIAALSGTNGILRKTAANTWSLDTSTYLTGNQTITFSGDATGSGSTSVTLTLANGSVTDAKIAAGAAIADTKLATISTAGKVSGTAITSGNISTSGSFATTSTLAVGQSSAAANTDFDLAGTYAQTVVAVGALNIDCSTGNYFTKSISTSSTFTFSNVPSSRAYSFTLEVNCTGASVAITWPASVKWPADTAPTLTDGKTHLFLFVTDDGGTTFRGASLVDYTT
jgi:hypothetical protein